MPLGNLTSQFFANVYLNELDQFVKHELKVKYYIRYVDDFVILHNDKNILNEYKNKINNFLNEKLKIELHPGKSKIIPLHKGIIFLGFRMFYHHRLLKKANIRRVKNQLKTLKEEYEKRKTDYNKIYNFVEGWFAYAKNSNSYKLRKNIANKIDEDFSEEISEKDINKWLKVYKKTQP